MENKEGYVVIWHYHAGMREPVELTLLGSVYANLITPDGSSSVPYADGLFSVMDCTTEKVHQVRRKEVYRAQEAAYEAYLKRTLRVQSNLEDEVSRYKMMLDDNKLEVKKIKEVLSRIKLQKKMVKELAKLKRRLKNEHRDR